MKEPDYFDTLYQNNSDPWHYQTRWYEKRKRAISLAVLPQVEYESAIELGCSNGVFSEQLAMRCGHLLCLDGNRQAVNLAAQRLKTLSHVNVVQAKIPQDLPAHAMQGEKFDLIVIGEILYYLTLADTQAVIAWIKTALSPNGTLLCCHWRYPIEGFEQNGETVHATLQSELNSPDSDFFEQVSLQDADFLLGVWQKQDSQSKQSVAQQEGLI